MPCPREQLMFPFHFLDRLERHDVTCTVSGGGRSAQAGAIRLAMARALCSFVTEDEVEWMRQGRCVCVCVCVCVWAGVGTGGVNAASHWCGSQDPSIPSIPPFCRTTTLSCRLDFYTVTQDWDRKWFSLPAIDICLC